MPHSWDDIGLIRGGDGLGENADTIDIATAVSVDMTRTVAGLFLNGYNNHITKSTTKKVI